MIIKKHQSDFSLIKIFGLISLVILLIITFLFILNPGQYLSQTRDKIRANDLENIMGAINQYSRDHFNDFSQLAIDNNPKSYQVISLDSNQCLAKCLAKNTTVQCLNLKNALGRYLPNFPQDPLSGNQHNTGYYININDKGHLVIGACQPENKALIEISE